MRYRPSQFLPTVSNCLEISNAINALSFSHDGEFIAIANAGSYIDIVSKFLNHRDQVVNEVGY